MVIDKNLLLVGAAVGFMGWMLYLSAADYRPHYSRRAVFSPDGAYVADVRTVPDEEGMDGTADEVVLAGARPFTADEGVVAAVPQTGTPCAGIYALRWVGRRTLEVSSDTRPSPGPRSWRDVRARIDYSDESACHLP